MDYCDLCPSRLEQKSINVVGAAIGWILYSPVIEWLRDCDHKKGRAAES